jgi:tetratricopeptide (TPR) repeat protein
VVLELKLHWTVGRLDDAAALLRSFLERPGLLPVFVQTLAKQAEGLGQLELAEQFYRRLAKEAPDLKTKLELALFLGRRGRIQDALDVCEPLWATPRNRELVAMTGLTILVSTAEGREPKLDLAQVNRFITWLDQGVAQDPTATRLLVGQANLYEQLGKYPEAEELYRKIINQNDRDGIASNNLAWLIALKDGRSPEALSLIESAIKLRGPLPDFLDTRGVVYLIGGDGPKAIADLETAVKAAPSSSKWFHLAQAYLHEHDKQKAKKCLEAAKSLGLPSGLHQLERTAYQKVLDELGRG